MKITKMWHTDLVEPSVIGKNDVDRLFNYYDICYSDLRSVIFDITITSLVLL